MPSRRVQLTKKLLKTSLLELLENQSLENIFVTDVCKNADVNRSTFYSYYDGTWQLMLEIEDDVLSNLPIPQDESITYSDERFVNILTSFFDYVKQEEKLFRILVIKHNNGNFNQRLIDTVMEKLPGVSKDRYTYIYCVNGIVGIIREWIMKNFPISTRKLAEITIELCHKTNH